MTYTKNLSLVNNKHPFSWISALSLGIAIILTRLNIYLGTQVNYLDHLSFFNALTLLILACVGIAILLSVAGVWKTRFRSLPLVVLSLASTAYLVLLLLID